MYYSATTTKSVADAARDLEASVKKHGFGVLHVHDLKDTLTRKGYPLAAECRIYEVCNPQQASKVLQRDMRLNAALPCRVSVFEDGGATRISTIRPSAMLGMLSQDPDLARVAAEVEATLGRIIDETAGTSSTAARQSLLARRATLAAEVAAGVAKRTADRAGLLEDVADSADLATADAVLDVDRAEVDRDMEEIAAIDAALQRIETNTYGVCVACGAPIEPARLATTPAAARCVACQRAAERREPPPARL
jgi:RNA polymerase-binding protein DksA